LPQLTASIKGKMHEINKMTTILNKQKKRKTPRRARQEQHEKKIENIIKDLTVEIKIRT
jgi:hypothetical protein